MDSLWVCRENKRYVLLNLAAFVTLLALAVSIRRLNEKAARVLEAGGHARHKHACKSSRHVRQDWRSQAWNVRRYHRRRR